MVSAADRTFSTVLTPVVPALVWLCRSAKVTLFDFFGNLVVTLNCIELLLEGMTEPD
jgi:hypothetical protein